MGQRGPKAKPAVLKALAGNPGKRPLQATNRPKFTPGSTPAPGWLGKSAKGVWRRTVKELEGAGVLSIADRDTLAAYCQAVADLEELSATISREGLIVDIPLFDRNGRPTGVEVRKPHPGLKWRQDLMMKVRQLGVEFGLTPASRSRAEATGSQPNGSAPRSRLEEIRERLQKHREQMNGEGTGDEG